MTNAKQISRNLEVIGDSALDAWVWDEDDLNEVLELWREGKDILEISDWIGRHEFEVAILIMDKIKQNRLTSRPEGIIIHNRLPKRGRRPKT